MGKIIIALLALVLVAAAGWFVWSVSQPSELPPASSITISTSTPQASTPQANTTGSVTTTNQTTQTSMPTNPTSATLHTNMGDIRVAFYPDQAPNTVENFLKLAASGFYDGTKFHRVIKGFMDQGGDPLTKDDSQAARWGTGGPGYTIGDEFGTTHPNIAGSLAMANTGTPNSAGSQFFINAVDNHFLDGKYAVFGQVTAGMDVVTKINSVPTGSSDRPLQPVVLESITLQ